MGQYANVLHSQASLGIVGSKTMSDQKALENRRRKSIKYLENVETRWTRASAFIQESSGLLGFFFAVKLVMYAKRSNRSREQATFLLHYLWERVDLNGNFERGSLDMVGG